MSFSSGQTVTVDREYFETLLQRVNSINDAFAANNTAFGAVSILKSELDALRATARKYDNLKRSLLHGGVENVTIELLSQDNRNLQAGDSQDKSPSNTSRGINQDGGARPELWAQHPPSQHHSAQQPWNSKVTVNDDPSGYDSKHSGHGYYSQSSAQTPFHDRHCSVWSEEGADEEHEDENDENEDDEVESHNERSPAVLGAKHSRPQGNREYFERQCDRSIVLFNLAEGTTHADITSAVWGGPLLNIYIRNDRVAQVSFLRSSDATKFLDHVRRHDLYIKNKRVGVKWADRQFVLPERIAGKIAGGATRYLVLMNYDHRHTEEVIRDDLDHIHDLVVIKIQFHGRDAHIELNSVHNAINARICMLSRMRYKNMKLNFGVDQCAQAFPPQQVPKAREAPQSKKPLAAITNRFQLLNCDEVEDDGAAFAFEPKQSAMAVA